VTRFYRRLPAADSIEHALSPADALSGATPVLHGSPSVPVVGCVEVLWSEAAEAVDRASGELLDVARGLG